MRKAKTLIISNHPGTRQFLLGIFREIPGIDPLGYATAGRDAVRKIHEVHPQLLFFDLQSAGENVIKMLLQIRNASPGVPVFLLSAEENHSPALILQTLSVGAADYIVIPHDFLNDSDQGRLLYVDLQKKLKLFFSRGQSEAPPPPLPVSKQTASREPKNIVSDERPVSPPRKTASPKAAIPDIELVVIGVSTGGPQALANLLPSFSADFSVPILIVQHMPEGFTAPLALRLNNRAKVQVVEAEEGMALEPGRAYIAPGNRHMVVAGSRSHSHIHIHQGPPENSCRPSVDVLFRSVTEIYNRHALAVVMTGMGQDGLLGSQALVKAGGKVLVQDEATSVVWGMPGAVMHAGLADQVLPLEHIAREIISRVPSPSPLKTAFRQELSLLQSAQERS